jgi:predicted aconitase
MYLTPEEQSILDGAQGSVLQKVMRSVVAYGEAFDADCLVPISGMPHMVTSFGANTMKAYFEILEEIIAAGLKTREPFTVDPRPMEFDALNPGLIKRLSFNLIFGKQADYEAQLRKLGLKDERAFTCACYLPEVGNTPQRGQLLAWSESSAVAFANSVLGARSNRNSAGIDLMCDVLGKAPRFGLLTDEGRSASWHVEVRTTKRPNPHLLGSAIGLKVVEAVPYITGLDTFLGHGLNPASEAFLMDMGASAASNGAVGLFHVENVTPEAIDAGHDLLGPDYKTYIIDDSEMQRVLASYPNIWKNPKAKPLRVFIGCPHLSRQQLEEWLARFEDALKLAGQEKTAVPVYLFTTPDLAVIFRSNEVLSNRMRQHGIHITTICPLMYMNNPLCAVEPIVTSSNKLRSYTGARFFLEEDILRIAITGQVL